MPIDYSIPLQARPLTLANPLDIYAGLSQLKDAQQNYQFRRLQMEERQRDLADDEAIRGAFQRRLSQTGQPDFDAIAGDLDYDNPRASMKFRKMVADWRKDQIDTLDKQAATTDRLLKQSTGLLQSVVLPFNENERDPIAVEKAGGLWRSIRPQLVANAKAINPALAEGIPEAYDPAFVSQASSWTETATEHQNRIKQALDFARQGLQDTQKADEYFTKSLATTLPLSQSQDEWDQFLGSARALGAPKETLAKFGAQFSPEAAQRADQLYRKGAEARPQQADIEVLRNGKWTPVPGMFDPGSGSQGAYFEAGSTTPLKPGEVRLRPRVSELGILTPGQQQTQQRFEEGREDRTETRLQEKLDDVETWYSKAIRDWEEKRDTNQDDLNLGLTDPKLRAPLEQERSRLDRERRSLDAELNSRKLRALNDYRKSRKLPPLSTLPPDWKPTTGSPQSSLLPTASPLPTRPIATGQLATARLPDVTSRVQQILREAGRDTSPQSVALFLQSPLNQRLLNLA